MNSRRFIIKLGAQLSDQFDMLAGVAQGSCLSPLLYAVFINHLPSLLRSCISRPSSSLTLNGLFCNSLLYADDIALVAKSAHDLQVMLDVCSNFAQSHGFVFSISKTKILLPSRPTSTRFLLHGAQLAVVDSFQYVGIWFTHSGIDHIRQARHLVLLACQRTFLLSLFIAGKNCISFRRRLEIYNVFIRPILDYGAQIIRYSKQALSLFDGFQDSILRRVLHVDHVVPRPSTLAICFMTGSPSFATRFAFLQMRYASRLSTLDESFLLSFLYHDYSAKIAAGSSVYSGTIMDHLVRVVVPDTAAFSTRCQNHCISPRWTKQYFYLLAWKHDAYSAPASTALGLMMKPTEVISPLASPPILPLTSTCLCLTSMRLICSSFGS